MYINFWLFLLSFFSTSLFLLLLICFISFFSFISFLVVLEFLSLIILFLLFLFKDFYCNKTFLVYYFFQIFFFLLMIWGYLFNFDILFYLSVFLKLGLFPFVWWIPYVIARLSFLSFFLLGVVKKILGLYILILNYSSILPFMEWFIYLVSIITVFISLLNSFRNQNNIKPLLAWSSSINYSMLISLFASRRLESFFLFFLVYSFLLSITLFFLNSDNYFWDQAIYSQNISWFVLFICFISFVGLPPFLGFFLKFSFFYGSQMSYTLLNSLRYFPWIVLLTLHSFIYINILVKVFSKKKRFFLLGSSLTFSSSFSFFIVFILLFVRLFFNFF